MSAQIREFIESHWDECIKENREDSGTLIGLPYPYTVPAVGHFDEMYYWDTYFTNKGLELSGRYAQAKSNTDNMLYLVNKYGFMPNGNRTYYLKRSQPPFLSVMVRDVYDHYRDEIWLRGAYYALEKEYSFWMRDRISPVGLNVYGGLLSAGADPEAAKDAFSKRVGFVPERSAADVSAHYALSCESGWDCNPRWGCEGFDYAPVDLNSLLYMMELNMAYFSEILKTGIEKEWEERAEKRRVLMNRCMDNGEGLLLDYNFRENKLSGILSAASFYPLFAGLASEKQARAVVNNLHRLEGEYGIFTCEKNDAEGVYQWDYPNGWACLQYIAFTGLDRYGYKEEAVRIAGKYKKLAESVFEETGNLWEKYNVRDGNIQVSNEYDMPAMMGWSAGVYLAAEDFQNHQQ